MTDVIDLIEELVETLNYDVENGTEFATGRTFTFPFKAQEKFDQSNPTFPCVVVTQVANRPRHMVSAELPEDNEATTTIGYQVEGYTRDTLDGDGNAYDKSKVANKLVDDLQRWFANKYGLQRNTWSPSSNVDDATLRSVFRVNGVIDRQGYIYRF